MHSVRDPQVVTGFRQFLLASASLWHRDVVRFLRQRSRVIGALAPPVLFWFLIGSGLGGSFRIGGTSETNYLQYFFPGTIMLIVLFTAIFSTISVIEDRHEGFLQSVLVAPLSREALVLGKILGGTTLAFGQGILFLCLAPVVGISMHWGQALYLGIILAVLSFGLTGLGFYLAWQLDSTQGFHAIMNLFLIPMWLLSGALFPASGAPAWLRAVIYVNPLTYGVAALQHSFLVNGRPLAPAPASPAVCLLISVGFSAVMFGISVATVRRSS